MYNFFLYTVVYPSGRGGHSGRNLWGKWVQEVGLSSAPPPQYISKTPLVSSVSLQRLRLVIQDIKKFISQITSDENLNVINHLNIEQFSNEC